MSSAAQAVPVKQEGLLSYEVGLKSQWLENQLQVNGAFFYYDYKDKQILGAETDPIFGPLAELVNVPNSHVIGFELSGAYAPEAIKGLTLTPSVSYQNSHIDNCTGAARAPRAPSDAIRTATSSRRTRSRRTSTSPASRSPRRPEWQVSFDGGVRLEDLKNEIQRVRRPERLL